MKNLTTLKTAAKSKIRNARLSVILLTSKTTNTVSDTATVVLESHVIVKPVLKIAAITAGVTILTAALLTILHPVVVMLLLIELVILSLIK